MNGRAIGRAHIAGRGMGTVFADADSKDYFTVQMDSGERLFRHRDTISFRKGKAA